MFPRSRYWDSLSCQNALLDPVNGDEDTVRLSSKGESDRISQRSAVQIRRRNHERHCRNAVAFACLPKRQFPERHLRFPRCPFLASRVNSDRSLNTRAFQGSNPSRIALQWERGTMIIRVWARPNQRCRCRWVRALPEEDGVPRLR